MSAWGNNEDLRIISPLSDMQLDLHSSLETVARATA